MPFMPNISARVERAGSFDAYGQTTLGAAQTVRIAIVTLDLKAEKTSVRTDASASRGNVNELVSNVRLLFPRTFEPAFGDKVTVAGRELKIVSVFPRHNIAGVIDHYQVDCDVWSE
jgi:hypothetical protein